MSSSAKDLSIRRLASLRTDHALCDGSIVADGKTFPVHIAIVADLSPFTKAACVDFKKGIEKSICLPKSSAAVVNVILDYAYGSFEPKQLRDLTLCLQVWRDAHMLGIDGLRHDASMEALSRVTHSRRIEVAQHAQLYDTDADRKLHIKGLAQNIMPTVRHCNEFGKLSFEQLIAVLTSEHIVADEDDVLSVILKWVDANPNAGDDNADKLFAQVHLEKLVNVQRTEELLLSEKCPRSLRTQAMRLSLKKMQGVVVTRQPPRSRVSAQNEPLINMLGGLFGCLFALFFLWGVMKELFVIFRSYVILFLDGVIRFIFGCFVLRSMFGKRPRSGIA